MYKNQIKQSPARWFALESNNQPNNRSIARPIDKPFDRPIDQPNKSPALLWSVSHTQWPPTTTAPGLGLASSPPPALNHIYMYNLNPNLKSEYR